MIDWLQTADGALFRFINLTLSNSFFDRLMPLASDLPGFIPFYILVIVLLICRGGARGRLCAVMLLLGICLGDVIIADAIKHGVARLRPFHQFPEAHLRVGSSDSFSMPSSHALNWFCAATIAFIFYRKSIYYMLPLALLVSFSRIYNGVHFPSDVLAGTIIGAGCGAALVWSTDALWQWSGRRWFPLWHARLPSILQPEINPRVIAKNNSREPALSGSLAPPAGRGLGRGDQPLNSESSANFQWLNLGYVLIGLLLFIGLAYLAAGKIQLSEDEAYQWIWSKHPALSYYSKPLLIACAQFIGTHLWGDNEFGVRFLSPIIAAVLSWLVLRFFAREINARVGFIVVLILALTPLTALGSILMTIDPLSVLFWTAAMIVGWRAAQPAGTTRQWLWMGLWMGLGFLSKYTNLFQWLCWALFFALHAPARQHLRRRGPWLALLIAVFCSLPVLIWNAQHNWITVEHVKNDGAIGQPWRHTFTLDFVLAEFGLLHPIFFVAALWAAVAFWGRGRKDALQLYLFSMGTPLFVFYFLWSFHSRVEPNWIAPSVVPMFCLMAIYWDACWDRVRIFAKPILYAGFGVGFVAVVLMHDFNLVTKIIHRAPPPELNPLRRVLGWDQFAAIVGQERRDLEARTSKPTFIICEHYGFTGQITFYLPEAKARVVSDPLVFFYASSKPLNQFYFWPNYLNRTGQNAIFVREVERPKLAPGWFSKWWHGSRDLYLPASPPPKVVPSELRAEFETITDLGVKDVVDENNRVLRRVQFFACENLLSQPRPE
jgi:4-amino-4-deoxy-L-arabinose transferase-like glycosyltransferase/membrane-associated phospholipid phosphatase